MASRQTQPHVRMRELRRSAGMSQADLARLLGLTRESVSRIEHGRVPCKRKQAIIEVWVERVEHAQRTGT